MVGCEVGLASQQGMHVCCACWACGSGAGSARSRAVAFGCVAPRGGEQHQEAEHAMAGPKRTSLEKGLASPEAIYRYVCISGMRFTILTAFLQYLTMVPWPPRHPPSIS